VLALDKKLKGRSSSQSDAASTHYQQRAYTTINPSLPDILQPFLIIFKYFKGELEKRWYNKKSSWQ
jgi:hypothetical protein